MQGYIISENQDTGTVLFDKSYLNDHCWTTDELIMLKSRQIFQDLLPKVYKFSLMLHIKFLN